MPAYYTQEWVAEVMQAYRNNPDSQNKHFKGMSMVLVLGNVAEPDIGIDKPRYLGTHIPSNSPFVVGMSLVSQT